MSQSDNSVLTHSPAYMAATMMSGLSTALSLLEGEFILAICLGAFTILLVLSRLGKVFSPKLASTLNHFSSATDSTEQADVSTPRRLSIVLALITLIMLWVAPEKSGVWIYSLPLMLMFFFEFRIAVPILVVTSLASIALISWQTSPLISMQAVPNFILFLGASCALVYLRELRRRQLKPLRRTDTLSDAASRQHLDQDLQKEVQRSEREGSDLSVIAFKVDDESIAKFDKKDHDWAQVEIGKLLHNNLRLFDSYYRLAQHTFLIVLPHTNSNQALKIADSLRVKIKQLIASSGQGIAASMGISHLNVGDDSESLVKHALIAQSKASERGGAQSYLFGDRDIEEQAEHGEDNAN